MIQTISYVYSCGRWVPAHDVLVLPRHRPFNQFIQASCAHILWRGDDLAGRSLEGIARCMVHDEYI